MHTSAMLKDIILSNTNILVPRQEL